MKQYEIYKDTFNPKVQTENGIKTIREIAEDLAKKEGGKTMVAYTDYDKRRKQIVRHVYAVNITKSEVLFKEVRRDFEKKPSVYRDLWYGWGMSAGTHVIWKKCYASWNTFEPCETWEKIGDYFYDRLAHTYGNEIDNVDNILACDSSLKYFGYVKNSEVNLIEYVKQYRKYPLVEVFMKLGLYRLIMNEKAIKTVSENKGFRKWLCANAKDCERLSFQHIFNSYKKNPNCSATDYYNSLMYRIHCGRELADKNKDIYNKILQYATQERLHEYGEKVGLSNYFDYLKACEWLKLDFKDTKVLFPKDFKTYHDLYCEQYGRYLEEERIKRELEAKKQREIEFKTTNDKMLEVAKQFQFCNYHNANYVVLLATNIEDLINEGEKMHHCVGKMGYDTKQANGESLICFVRNINEQDTPLATVELNLRNKKLAVSQCYGKYNDLPSEDIINFVENEWLSTIQKAYDKVRKETKTTKHYYKGFYKQENGKYIGYNNYEFEVGGTYETEITDEQMLDTLNKFEHNKGFHFCESITEISHHYSPTCYCEVEPLGAITESNGALLTNKIRIVKALSENDVLLLKQQETNIARA